MGKRPWMPLYVGDFLADTQHLGATETGIYVRLLMHCWQHGSIPLEPRKLALISHCDTRLWHQYGKAILPFFDVVDASTATHRRIVSELHRCDEISSKRKAAALQKHKIESANALQKPTQSQSHIERKKEETPPTPPRGGRGRKTQIAANWELSEEGRSYAFEKGKDSAWIARETDAFRDYALKNGKTYVDWEAAWRTWVRSPFQAVVPLHTNGVRPMSVRDMQRVRTEDALSDVDRKIERDESNGSDEGGPEAYRTIPTHNRH